jgi:hypothetical protein
LLLVSSEQKEKVMTKKKQTWVLMDGSYTNSFAEYKKEWEDIYRPIEEFMGVTISGFDPCFNFNVWGPTNPDTGMSPCKSVQLPYWFAAELSEKIKQLRQLVMSEEYCLKCVFLKTNRGNYKCDRFKMNLIKRIGIGPVKPDGCQGPFMSMEDYTAAVC